MTITTPAHRQGFTLVENMIVVVIIGLLAAIAVPSFVRSRTRSAHARCVNNLRQIESAKAQWAVESKAGPTALPTDANLFGAGLYLKKKPECAAGGQYTVNTINNPPTCDRPGHVLN